MTQVTGWDVGGAHLKAALIDDGVVKDVVQFPSLIWTDLKDLRAALDQAIARVGDSDVHAVTMTGELAEYFGGRVEGVRQISELMRDALRGREVKIYAGRSGFVEPDDAENYVEDISSANWYGTAAAITRKFSQGILIDIGSSTTDVIPIYDGKVAAAGYSDAERLASGELIYTGMVRTPVMAVADKVPFGGEWQGLMAERFAVMADVYRVLDWLPEGADMFPAVDDRPKDQAHSRARLARMLGRDVSDHADWEWEQLARYLVGAQMVTIEESVRRAQSRYDFMKIAPIIGAGVGRLIAQDISNRLSNSYRPFIDVVQCDSEARGQVSVAAPAVAVGLLA